MMDKPAKTRRRRSIRNLRASAGFLSPPLPSAPYGSAWIDQDQETNMDNLVTSFSQLNCDCDNIDNAVATVDDNPADPKYQKNCTSLSQSPVDIEACEISSGANFEDGLAKEIERGISETSSVPSSYDSFSFSVDMPLGVNSVGKHLEACSMSPHFDFDTITNTSCVIDNIEENIQENSEIQIGPNTVECAQRDEIKHMLYFNDQDLKQVYSELSLNFSQFSEEDQSTDFLVKALNCGFNGSFSYQGDYPDSPIFSQSPSFNNGIMNVSSYQETSGTVLSPDEAQTSVPHFLNKTYDVTPEDELLKNRSCLIFPNLVSDVNGMPYASPNMMSGRCINDEEEEHSQNMDIARVDSTENSNKLEINKSIGSESSEIDSLAHYVNTSETTTTINSTQETDFDERIQNALVNEARYSNAHSIVNDHETIELEKLKMIVSTNDREKLNKRSKRRSSRKFQLQEFSIAFQHPDEQSSKVVTFASDNDLRLCSLDILESEKENLLCCEQVVDLKNVNNELPSGDKVVLSDCSNNQNIPKKRGGRKSGRITFRKKKDKSASLETNEFVNNSSSSTKITSEFLDAECLSDNTNESEVDDLSQNKSQVESNANEFIEEDSFEESDPAPIAKTLKTKRNRKSWGNVSSNQTAIKIQERKSIDEEESPSFEIENSDLEQLYKQKKYSPITPRLLETIKEIPCRGVLIGKQKIKRFIHFPEDYRPTVWKKKSRTKKMIKHFKKGLDLNPVDDEEFHLKLKDIMIDLASLDD